MTGAVTSAVTSAMTSARARPLCPADAVIVASASAVLLALAHRFDFFCDDAFITLRYAENLARHGAPVYNLGERVEGYTSVAWLMLSALGARLPLPLPVFVQGLGALSSIGLLSASWALLGRVLPAERSLRVIALLALATSAPIAAWTLGGLETPLFAALTTWALLCTVDLREQQTTRRGLLLGLVLALATLTRPEGALVAATVLLTLAPTLARTTEGRRAWLAASLLAASIVGAHVAWRYGYYGYPLPNTFYLKSSGDAALMRTRGITYLGLAARELGLGFVLAVVLGLLLGARGAFMHEPHLRARAEHARRTLTWIGRLLIPSYVLYVLSVGGDFLDLYRFLVPLLPLGVVLFSVALSRLGGGTPVGVPATTLALGVLLLGLHAHHQHALAERARQVSEPERAQRGIEPLGWTRLYALRWAAMGRWIAAHAEPSDRMAVGAAGAMPYYAGIYNLDTFGLCDAWIAHHAPIVSNRPGHQRFAPRSYILSKDPVFLLIGNDFARDAPATLRRDPSWERLGYVWAEAKVDAARFGAPSSYYHYFLMRLDRARAHESSPWLRFRAPAAKSAP